MNRKNKIKLLIPNILTMFRLIITPFIVILGLLGHFKIVIILIIIAALTDLFDGKLARYLNVVSDFGAKLDTVSDKVFAIALSLAVIKTNQLMIVIAILEIITAIMNIYFYKKNDNVKSLFIGKVKTTALFITIVLVYIAVLNNKITIINTLIRGFTYITINLQILTIIYYIIYNLNLDKNKNIEITNTLSDSDLEKTILVDNIDLLNEKDYDDII